MSWRTPASSSRPSREPADHLQRIPVPVRLPAAHRGGVPDAASEDDDQEGYEDYQDQVQHGFLHSHSYTGNPLACAAALACLEIFESESVLEKNRIRSQELAAAFEWAKTDSRIEHWRQQGMILAFDVKPSSLKNPNAFPREMFAMSLSEGSLIRPIGNTVYVMPPYVLTLEETQAMGQSVKRALDKVLA